MSVYYDHDTTSPKSALASLSCQGHCIAFHLLSSANLARIKTGHGTEKYPSFCTTKETALSPLFDVDKSYEPDRSPEPMTGVSSQEMQNRQPGTGSTNPFLDRRR
jgi:hypothetical protein